MDFAAVDDLVRVLDQRLADQLEAVYLYGSATTPYYVPGRSDINLIAIVAEGTSLHSVREAFGPVWLRHQAVLGRPPAVMTQATLTQLMALSPAMSHHLYHHAEAYAGKLAPDSFYPDPVGQAAYLVTEAMRASTALASRLLSPRLVEQAHHRLHRLARQLANQALPDTLTSAQLFALIQDQLNKRVGSFIPGRGTAPLALRRHDTFNLEGIYRDSARIIFVIPALAPQLLLGIDWDRLSESIDTHFQAICVTTAAQLRLSVRGYAPLDFLLSRLEHAWGQDPLATLSVPPSMACRTMARRAAIWANVTLTQQYLAAANPDEVHRVIHDLQNRLLNLQLQSELLYRLQSFPRPHSPEPLPGREAPQFQRIDAIHRQLSWWMDHYSTLAETVDDNYATPAG